MTVRVLVLSNMYPPHHLGGYELSCRDVVRRWRAAGHHVSVLTTTMRLAGVSDGDEPHVQRRLHFYWDDHRLLSPPLWQRAGWERDNQRWLSDALQHIRPDVVSVWNMGCMSLGLLSTLRERGIPTVFVVCDDWLDYAPRLDAWTRLFRKRPRLAATVRRVTQLPTAAPDLDASGVFCFVSEHVRRHARQRTQWRFPLSTVVYSGIDPQDFPPLAEPPDRPWQWRLLGVGRIEPRKGFDVAISALSLLPEAHLELIGPADPHYRKELLTRARKLGVGDRLALSRASRGDLAERYEVADAVLFTSAWEEPFGLVPVEAMACGTPVVANLSGGNREFLAPEWNCLAAPRGDAFALARAVRRLATDPALRRRLAEGGLRTARCLTVDTLAAVLERWHRSAAEGMKGGLPPHRCPPVTRPC